MSSLDNNIALIGFGEAASASAAGWGVARARNRRGYYINAGGVDYIATDRSWHPHWRMLRWSPGSGRNYSMTEQKE